MFTLSLMFLSAKITPGGRPMVGFGGNDGVHAVRQAGEVAIRLDVVEQVHAEVVEAEVGDRDAGL